MDAERRHELKQNELAEALTRVRTYANDPQAWYWIGGIALIVIVFLGYRVWTGIQARQRAAGWQELQQVEPLRTDNPAAAVDELRRLVREADASLAAMARLELAAALRQQAEENAEKWDASNAEAVEVLQPVVNDSGVAPPIAAAALYSLGTSYENLRRFEQARAVYQRLTGEPAFEGSPFVPRAADRLETMDEVSVQVPFEPGVPPAPETPPVETQPTESILLPPTAPTPGEGPVVLPGQPGEAPPPEGATTQPAEAPAPAENPAPEEPAGDGAP